MKFFFCKTEKLNNIDHGKLNETQILHIIKQNENLNNKKFTLQNIFTYNITLRPNELVNFLQNDSETKYFKNYITLETVEFKETIEVFKELNEIYFLYRHDNPKNNVTKKKNSTNNRNKFTRKNKN